MTVDLVRQLQTASAVQQCRSLLAGESMSSSLFDGKVFYIPPSKIKGELKGMIRGHGGEVFYDADAVASCNPSYFYI